MLIGEVEPCINPVSINQCRDAIVDVEHPSDLRTNFCDVGIEWRLQLGFLETPLRLLNRRGNPLDSRFLLILSRFPNPQVVLDLRHRLGPLDGEKPAII